MLAVAVSARAPTADPLDRGYVVPQASDHTVTGEARWGSRPMAEHRVMSEASLANALQVEKMPRIARNGAKNNDLPG